MDEYDFGRALYAAKRMGWKPTNARCPDYGDVIAEYFIDSCKVDADDALEIAKAIDRFIDATGLDKAPIPYVVKFADFCRRGEFYVYDPLISIRDAPRVRERSGGVQPEGDRRRSVAVGR